MPERLVVPTEDLFAWTLRGRDSLLATPHDDPRTALSHDRYALRHLLARHRHVAAFGATVVGDLLGALADPSADPSANLPGDLPGDVARLRERLDARWAPSAARRAALTRAPRTPGPVVPDDDCAHRAARTALDVVPPAVLLDLLRWAGQDWPTRRRGWPSHLSWPAAPHPANGHPASDRFGDRPHLVHVLTPTTTLTAPRRLVVRAAQDAGLDVLHLRVNVLGEVPHPGDQALGVQPAAPPACPACPPTIDPDPPAHLLPGERPLPPFLSPGLPEEPHDHHLRAALAATPARTVSPEVRALSEEDLQLAAFTLLTHPGARGTRTPRTVDRRHLTAATRRHRDLTGDPHLPHEQDRAAETLRDALTTWHRAAPTPPSPERDTTHRAATRAAATHLALQGVDVLALHEATDALDHLQRTDPAGHPDPVTTRRLYRLLRLGFTGAELLRMDRDGTTPDEHALALLTALRA